MASKHVFLIEKKRRKTAGMASIPARPQAIREAVVSLSEAGASSEAIAQFDPRTFLARLPGKTSREYRDKQAIFSQGRQGSGGRYPGRLQLLW